MQKCNLKYNYVFLGYVDDYYKYYLAEIKDIIYLNNKPNDNYHIFKKKLSKLILSHKINTFIDMPFKSFFLDGITYNCFKDKKPLCFLLHGSYEYSYTKRITEYIRKKYLSSKIVLYCTDKIELYYEQFGKKKVDKLLKSVDFAMTYNKHDAKKYNMILSPPTFPCFDCFSIKNDPSLQSDFLFVGNDKNRHDLLHKIYFLATKQGYKCDFNILNVPEEKRIKNCDINYVKNLSYEEVLTKVFNTKCIINIVQRDGAGLALRDYEAIYYQKYLITDNEYIFESPIYNDNQIIRININNINETIHSIEKPFIPISFPNYTWKNCLIQIDKYLN